MNYAVKFCSLYSKSYILRPFYVLYSKLVFSMHMINSYGVLGKSFWAVAILCVLSLIISWGYFMFGIILWLTGGY